MLSISSSKCAKSSPPDLMICNCCCVQAWKSWSCRLAPVSHPSLSSVNGNRILSQSTANGNGDHPKGATKKGIRIRKWQAQRQQAYKRPRFTREEIRKCSTLPTGWTRFGGVEIFVRQSLGNPIKIFGNAECLATKRSRLCAANGFDGTIHRHDGADVGDSIGGFPRGDGLVYRLLQAV